VAVGPGVPLRGPKCDLLSLAFAIPCSWFESRAKTCRREGKVISEWSRAIWKKPETTGEALLADLINICRKRTFYFFRLKTTSEQETK